PEKIKVVEKEVVVDSLDTGKFLVAKGPLLPWFMNVRPHEDIERGNLDESVFAANLGDVALGTGREVYRDPEQFFPKTYFTAGLKNLARQVIRGLNGNQEADNRVISLQTGFGGGKTHSLISLYHLVRKGEDIVNWELTSDIIDEIGKPEFENANVAVVTNSTNDPTQGRTVDGIHIKTIWGELAFQLGGRETYEIIRQNDENRTTPKGLFKKVLEKTAPCLILIDELADYCVAASGVPVGALTLSDQTISFIQELSESISVSNQCVAVVTLPASPLEVASSEKGHQILVSLNNRLSRVGKDTKPVEGDEIFEVIRRRLFEDLGDKAEIEKVVKHYYDYYKTLDYNHEIPQYADRPDY
ncbi:MAG: ATP-binding protein, partial [Bacteroidales bacterium]|nr:ATP-binding protein [Bacteroidales bacterium]